MKNDDERGTSVNGRTVRSGKRVYGVDVGIIMLDTDSPRAVGDVGNGRSYKFPVQYAVAYGAKTQRVIEEHASGLLDKFVETGELLVDAGVGAVASTCGLCGLYQAELSAALPVPVATTSMLQIPLALRVLGPDSKVCVLTIKTTGLSPKHFEGVGLTEELMKRVKVVGLENTAHFYPALIEKQYPLDLDLAERDIIETGLAAIGDDPGIQGFVFECANLGPYSAGLRQATGLPVWDSISMINWLEAGVRS
jgi:hypothetical protein